jgi:serine/threonine-protein kinase
VNYGRYQIVKELGRGSMGMVYLARDPNIERMVAVKVLRQDRMGSDIFVKRFIKEAKVIGRLSHPHTVTIYDIGEENEDVYIAMEYVEGTPLSNIVKEKRLDAQEVVEFGVQIAETLDYAHRKGVVHRDIKPSNIIVQPDGLIKITDFGVARVEDSSATLQTMNGEILGTPAYMSPEQVLGKPVDGRSDLFSLGVVLYELSTGKRPFGGEGKTLATVFNEIIQTTPPDPNIASGQVPRELSALIMKALQKEPAKRFQSGREMAEALKECLGGGKREEAATTTQAQPVQRRRIGYTISLAGAALISIIAGGIFFFSDQQVISPVKKSLETRKASLPVPQRTVLINPSIPLNAPTIKQGEAPVKGMPKEVSKPAPSNVQIGSVAKQTVKPDAKPAKDRKPFISPIAAQERPAVKKAESSAGRLAGNVNAARPNPVATEKAVIDKPPRQSGVTQPPLPVKSTPLPKFAFLRVRTSPKGATVYVNGSPKGTSPLTLKLGLGKYRVKLCRAGYRDTECLVGLDRMADYPIIEKLRPIE